MPVEVRIPATGNEGADVVLTEWSVVPGTEVTAGQTVAVVETAKASLDIEAPCDGVLLAALVPAGREVAEHQVVAVIGAPGDVTPDPAPTGAPRSEDGDGARDRVAASPRARTLAARRGMDLAEMTGSGPGGRVLAADVTRLARAAPTASVPSPDTSYSAGAPRSGPTPSPPTPADGAPHELEPTDVVPVRGIRRITGDRMLSSLRSTAQLTLTRCADATALLAFRERWREAPASMALPPLTVNDLLLFSMARTLARHGEANAHLVGEEIRHYSRVDLGFAVQTDRGLLVPVIRGAEGLGLAALARAAHDLTERGRAGELAAAELAGATSTVTNLGSRGVLWFTPVLAPPEVVILGVGARTADPADPQRRPALPLSLTFDHRALDGADAADLLADVADDIAHVDLLCAL